MKSDMLAGMVDRLTDEVTYLRGRVDSLTTELLAMRRDGFDPPAAAPPNAPQREEIAGDIMAAIRDVADWGTDEYYAMIAEAGALCAAHPEWEAKRVAAEVTQGSPINPHRL